MKKHLILILLIGMTACNNASQDEVKIISYNIRVSTVDDGAHHWNLRKAASIRMINEEKPSAFGLQEAMPEQILYLEENLPNYQRAIAASNLHESSQHCSIFYDHKHYNLLQCYVRWLCPTPEYAVIGWDAAYLRTATLVQLQEKRSRKTFWYINTHLDHMGQVARDSSVALLCQWIDEILSRDPQCPILLGGDMNTTLKDPTLQPLIKRAKIPHKTTSDENLNGTYHGWGTVQPALAIDLLFYQNAIPRSFERLDGDYGVPFISDHYPIAFTWSFK